MKKLCLVISILLFIAATEVFGGGFLYHSDGPYKGKVINLETGEPIEGAVVAVVWYLTHRFCDAKETVTDKNGEFLLQKGSCFSFFPFTEMDPARVVVFKPGYLAYPPLGATPEERKARMPGLTGDEFQDKKQYNTIRLGKPKTQKERELTFGDANSPFTNDQAFRKLPMLLKMVNDEAKNLGITGKIGP